MAKKVKNLLILGAVNPGAIENVFVRGFEKLGVNVVRYDIYDRYIQAISRSILHKVANKISPALFYQSINRDVLRFVSGKSFDAILVFKGMELFPDTLKKLKANTSLLANHNGDHPFVFFFPGSGNQNITDGIPLYDVHFSYAKSIVSKFQKEFNKSAFRIPFGYDAELKISGTPSADRFAGKFLFIGAYDQERAKYLDELKHPLLHIYGDNKWSQRNMHKPYLQSAYQNKALYGVEYRDAIHDSTGMINILREQNLIEDSHNMRTFEVPGYGGLLISQRTSEQQEFFEDGKEAIYFDSIEELRSRMDFLAENPSLGLQIKQAAFARAQGSGYSYDHRSSELLDCLNASL